MKMTTGCNKGREWLWEAWRWCKNWRWGSVEEEIGSGLVVSQGRLNGESVCL
jgi:hypothetical protein